MVSKTLSISRKLFVLFKHIWQNYIVKYLLPVSDPMIATGRIDDIMRNRILEESNYLLHTFPHIFKDEMSVLRNYHSIIMELLDEEESDEAIIKKSLTDKNKLVKLKSPKRSGSHTLKIKAIE